MCAPCHSGAGAPEGLQLDAAHSYALLIGVPSAEVPALLRVKPGAPDDSYLVLKLQGSADIVGAQMPFGEPPLPQATIDVIRQWITDGATRSGSATAASFSVTGISPPDGAVVSSGRVQLAVAFSREVDASLVNYTTLRLDRLSAQGTEPATDSLSLTIAAGDPNVVLITPDGPLAPGVYRLTLRGTGGGALADVNAQTLGHDDSCEFTVEASR